MKRLSLHSIVLTYLLSLFSLNGLGYDKGMYSDERVIENAIHLTISAPKTGAPILQNVYSEKFHCADPVIKGNPNSGDLSRFSINTGISCVLQCTGKAEITKPISSVFDPDKAGLVKGDGYREGYYVMIASYGISLFSWAARNCLDLASQECGGISKVEKVDVAEISSGDWKQTQRLNCQKTKEPIYSPFDSELKPDYSAGAVYRSEKPAPKNASVPEQLNESKLNSPDCKKRISAHVCLGDCIADTSTKTGLWRATLQTNEHGADYDQTVCADDLVKVLTQENIKPQVAKIYCEEYFWNLMRKSHAMGSSCAAFRGEVNCDEIVNSIKK